MAQANFDWVKGTFHTLADPDLFVMPMPASNTIHRVFELIDSTDLESKEDSLRVERVVGDAFHLLARDPAGSPGFGCELFERIYVTDVGITGVPVIQHPEDEADFDRTWMWQRRRWIADSTQLENEGAQKEWLSPSNGRSPYYSLIDMRVKARLRDRNVLIYQVTWSADPNHPFVADDTLVCAPMLRVGVKF